jgi:hypothetical protein
VKRASGQKPPVVSGHRLGQPNPQEISLKSSADTAIKTALEHLAAASDEELSEYLEAIKPEDLKRILRLAASQCHVLQRERMFRAGATLSGEADGVFNGE